MSTATITSDCQGGAQPTDGDFPNVGSVAAFLQALMQPDGVTQIFVKDVKDSGVKHYLGYYDGSHVGQLIDDAADFSGRATGIYIGMNPLWPTCLGRSPNCVTPVAEAPAAKTEDVSRRRWLLVDVDPVRAGVVPATDGEKHEASLLARRMEDTLMAAGWPEPIRVDSGNGFQLLYRIDLPVEDDSLLKRVLRSLAEEFDTDAAKVERGVFDATRVVRLPGTMNCKGDCSAGRPHRQSRIVRLPQAVAVVPETLLEQLAARVGTPTDSKGDPSVRAGRVYGPQSPAVLARAQAYLAKMDPAISGQRGRKRFFSAACRLVDDFALPEEQARPLLEEYNQRCQPPFDADDVKEVLRSALANVSERGGPSARLLEPPAAAVGARLRRSQASYIGVVPDLSFADSAVVLSSVDAKAAPGVWLFWLSMWQQLSSRVRVRKEVVRQWAWGATYDRNWRSRLAGKTGDKNASPPPEIAANPKELRKWQRSPYVRVYNSCGVLESFCDPALTAEKKPRNFDLFGDQYREKLRELRRSGRLFNVYWPALVLGSSPKVGWPWRRQRLLVGVVRELTRANAASGADMTGEVIVGGLVAATTASGHRMRCPLLSTEQRYNTFGGNGSRKGRGYHIVGRTGKGWIFRCGYLNAPTMSPEERIKAIGSFLEDLKALSVELDLVPAAIGPGSKPWKSIDEMLECHQKVAGRNWLEACTLRIYVPADWRTRWRAFFSRKLGFAWIPEFPGDSRTISGTAPVEDPPAVSNAEIRAFLARTGMTQNDLAGRIAAVTGKSCSPKRVGRHLAGKSKSRRFYDSVARVMQQQEGSEDGKSNR